MNNMLIGVITSTLSSYPPEVRCGATSGLQPNCFQRVAALTTYIYMVVIKLYIYMYAHVTKQSEILFLASLANKVGTKTGHFTIKHGHGNNNTERCGREFLKSFQLVRVCWSFYLQTIFYVHLRDSEDRLHLQGMMQQILAIEASTAWFHCLNRGPNFKGT